MANRRVKIVDGLVNPAVMSGLHLLADTVTITATGKYVELTFPCKSIIAVTTSSFLDTDAEKVVTTASVTNDVATVRFTKTTASSDTFSYIILYTLTETLTSLSSAADYSVTPVS